MGVKNRKSIGGNASFNGGPVATPKTPDNKRKSLSKPAPPSNKKSAPSPSPALETPISPKKQEKVSPEKKPVINQKPQQQKQNPLAKVSEQSKAINKKFKNKNKPNKNKPAKGPQNQNSGTGKDQANQQKKSKKNNRQRFQAKLSSKPRSPLSQSRAFKAEQEMNKNSNRILLVKLPDQVVTNEQIKGWSSSIENALFPKPIEPRSFLVVLKPEANVKKEIETLKKVSFGGGKLIVEERKQISYEGKAGDGVTAEDLIDPYTLYLTNLDESVTRDDLKTLFPAAGTVMNPRKHSPRVSGTGTMTKFAFVGFDSAESALEGFKMCFNKKFNNDKFIIVRFRRIGKNEISTVKEAGKTEQADAAVKRKAEVVATPAKGKRDEAKKSKVIKIEPKLEPTEGSDDEEEEDSDEEEDDDDEELDVDAAGLEDSDDDDEDDGLEDENDEDDEEEDDEDDD